MNNELFMVFTATTSETVFPLEVMCTHVPLYTKPNSPVVVEL